MLSGERSNAEDDLPKGVAQAAGFYAVAYKTTADIGDPNDPQNFIAAGTTIISYRGTDNSPAIQLPAEQIF